MGNDMPVGTQGARNSSPRTQAKRPGDLTGIRNQQLAKEAAAQKAEAASQVETALAEEKAKKLNTVVDYTGQQTTPKPDVVEEDVEVEAKPKFERIRVNYPLPDMTFGKEILDEGEQDEHGNWTRLPQLGGLRTYNFEEGVWYDVPTDVADHLRRIGYLWE
jgi:hypothetical protein